MPKVIINELRTVYNHNPNLATKAGPALLLQPGAVSPGECRGKSWEVKTTDRANYFIVIVSFADFSCNSYAVQCCSKQNTNTQRTLSRPWPSSLATCGWHPQPRKPAMPVALSAAFCRCSWPQPSELGYINLWRARLSKIRDKNYDYAVLRWGHVPWPLLVQGTQHVDTHSRPEVLWNRCPFSAPIGNPTRLRLEELPQVNSDSAATSLLAKHRPYNLAGFPGPPSLHVDSRSWGPHIISIHLNSPSTIINPCTDSVTLWAADLPANIFWKSIRLQLQASLLLHNVTLPAPPLYRSTSSLLPAVLGRRSAPPACRRSSRSYGWERNDPGPVTCRWSGRIWSRSTSHDDQGPEWARVFSPILLN